MLFTIKSYFFNIPVTCSSAITVFFCVVIQIVIQTIEQSTLQLVIALSFALVSPQLFFHTVEFLQVLPFVPTLIGKSVRGEHEQVG